MVERKRFSEKDAANAVYQAQPDTTRYLKLQQLDSVEPPECAEAFPREMLLAVNYIHSHDIAAWQQRNYNVFVSCFRSSADSA